MIIVIGRRVGDISVDMTVKPRKVRRKETLTYSGVGVDRSSREKSRKTLSEFLERTSRGYEFGKALRLPFGLLFPTSEEGSSYYDFQIEGVGTKTLLAELSRHYGTIGIDGVAMVVNDIIRSGAKPLLVSDAIHISKSDRGTVNKIVDGVMEGASIAGCVIASGETGDVPDILHGQLGGAGSCPFDLMVAGLGVVERDDVFRGEISVGDQVIGIESSGVHSNGLTLARKVLLTHWGGKFRPSDKPEPIDRPVIEELMEPTRIYVKPLLDAAKRARIKAAVHITGDGLAKFHRLLDYQSNFKRGASRLGVQFQGLGETPGIFRLIYDTARATKKTIRLEEMFRTFNMGYGFAVVVGKKEADNVLDSFNKYCPARTIGQVNSSGRISVKGLKGRENPMEI